MQLEISGVMDRQSNDMDALSQEMVALMNDNRSLIDRVNVIGRKIQTYQVK